MILVLIAGKVYIVIGILLSLISFFVKQKATCLTITCTLYMAGILNVMIYNYAIKAPSALDVYKSETVLKITNKDKVPVDSVVIYKKGDNHE